MADDNITTTNGNPPATRGPALGDSQAQLRPMAGVELKPDGKMVQRICLDIVYLEDPDYTLRQLVPKRAAGVRWVIDALPDLLGDGSEDGAAYCSRCADLGVVCRLALREDVGAFAIIQFGIDEEEIPLIVMFCRDCAAIPDDVRRLTQVWFHQHCKERARDQRAEH